MAAPKRPLAKPDQDEPKYIDPFVYGDSGRRITISPGTNPITQLGQTTGSEFREYGDDDLNIRGMYLPPQTVNEIEYEGGDAPPESRSAQFFAEKHPDKDPLQMDDIMITLKGVENNQTAIHEFMHRGFERLRNAYDRDEVESRFGRSVANILFEPDYEHYLVQSVLEDEGIESTNNYTEGVTKSSKEKLTKTVAALNELASDEMGMLGFQTEKDSGPKTRPKRKPKKEKKSFFKRLFNFSEGGDVTPLNPKARPRTKTEEKTLRGRSVWIDHTGEVTGEKGAKYSEVTTTIPWGTEWITAPSVDENGKRLSDDEVKQRLLETRGKDFITGEELPTFSNPEKASEYAQWRSDTMFDQEAIEQGFPEEFPMGPEPERKDLIDRSIDKGKDFLEYLTTPSKHGVFNKGGAVMNEQMEMAFMQEGGLQDDGMDQDPVSGNEVPSGSMASEVRDDISAQLSEGEYVVPADVVRFFGVKFFEDLRMQAKIGLQTMEANGRIGGEPVDSSPEEEVLSDKDFAMLLQQELGGTLLAEGGMVSGESQSYSAEEPRQFNRGGYSTADDAPEEPYVPGLIPSFDPSNYGLGFSMTPGYTRPPASPTIETDKSCEARGMILGPNGICIPKPEPKRGGDGSSGTTPPPPGEGGSINLGGDNWFKDDSELLFSDPSTYIKNQLANRGGRFDSGIARAGALALPGGLGLILAGGDTADDTIGIAKARAALMVAEASGAIGEKEAKELRELITQDVQGNFFVDKDGKGPGIGTGVNWANSLAQSLGFENLEDLQSNKTLASETWKAQTKTDTKAPVKAAADEQKTLSGVTQAQMDAANAQAKIKQKAAASARRDNKDSGPSGAEVAAAAAQKAAEKEVKESEDKPQGNLGSSSGGAGAGGFGGGGGGGVYAGGRATGGLVSRPKKKK